MRLFKKDFKFSSLYFGWWMTIVVTLWFTLVSGFGGGATIIFKPLAADLDLTRAAASVAMGIGSLQGGIVFPLAGWLSDKFGSKWLVIAGCAVTGTGMVLLNFVQSAWSYYLVWGLLISGGSSLGFSVVVDRLLTDWFIKKRGLALSVRFLIAGVIMMVLLPVLGLLIANVGWRTTSLIWSATALIGIPIAFIFVRQKRPEYYGLLPDGEKAKPVSTVPDSVVKKTTGYVASEEKEFTLKQALATPAYWLLTLIWVLFCFVYGGINVHIVPMLTDMGIEAVAAAGMMSLMTFFSLPSRFFGGVIADRVSKEKTKYLIAATLGIMTLGVAAMLLPEFSGKVYLFLIFWGLGTGAYVPLDIIIRSRFYGRKAYGAVQGISMIFSAPIGFFAPIFSGRIFDTYGNYTLAIIVFTVLAVISVFTIFLIRVPKLKTDSFGEKLQAPAYKL
jgi:MFS family permease